MWSSDQGSLESNLTCTPLVLLEVKKKQIHRKMQDLFDSNHSRPTAAVACTNRWMGGPCFIVLQVDSILPTWVLRDPRQKCPDRWSVQLSPTLCDNDLALLNHVCFRFVTNIPHYFGATSNYSESYDPAGPLDRSMHNPGTWFFLCGHICARVRQIAQTACASFYIPRINTVLWNGANLTQFRIVLT